MKTTLYFFLAASVLFAVTTMAQENEFRRLSVKDYRDKMKAGWIGQIVGVSWGAPTEFQFNGKIIPEDKVPRWWPEMINNAFGQDDIYVEMTFLQTLERYGLDVSQRQAGIDFAKSQYYLWHANLAGRMNLRDGIAPPDSGHPAFNQCADDIDYQIEADFSGLVAPGMPQIALELGDKFGALMNYGDGIYGGQFVGGMYTEAFFETDIVKIVHAGLLCIPPESQYAEMVRDLLKWYEENPTDWTATWKKIDEKYHKNKNYRCFRCDPGAFNIDTKINGAYILMGLLYGEGDPDKTVVISMRCGQDSDCNPSNAGGVLFTTLGFSKLSPRFTEKLDETKKFAYTAYNFPALLDACEKVAREAVTKSGGKIEKNENGDEVFLIPVQRPKPGKYTPSCNPDPPQNCRFTDEEMARIGIKQFKLNVDMEKVFPGWKVSRCGTDMNPGIREEFRGRKNVLMTYPYTPGNPCMLTKTVEIPASGKTRLKVVVSHHDEGDWELVIRVDDDIQMKRLVSKDTVGADGWLEVGMDLSKFSGKKIKITLENLSNGWKLEAGYWGVIEIETQ